MINQIQEFLNLLKLSNELAKNDKYLFKEDPEKEDKLLKFSARMETNLHIRYKDKYIKLIDLFLNDNMTAEVFSACFMRQYEIVNETLEEMNQDFEKNLDQLSNLLTESVNKNDIGISLLRMYDHCDMLGLNPDSLISDEAELKNSAKILLSELKQI